MKKLLPFGVLFYNEFLVFIQKKEKKKKKKKEERNKQCSRMQGVSSNKGEKWQN